MRPQHIPPVQLGTIADLIEASGGHIAPAPWQADIDWRGLTVTGVAVASGDVVPGDLFFAVKGYIRHGAEFAGAAVAAGAVAVICDQSGIEVINRDDFQGAQENTTPVLVVTDAPIRPILGEVARLVFADPTAKLVTVGVTGTNGKSTVGEMVRAALTSTGNRVARFGTLGMSIGADAFHGARTTSESAQLEAGLALAVERGNTAAVVEVSSIALSEQRLAGMHFSAVGFTNLQQDHLDYHGDMQHYYEAKLALFQPELSRSGAVCTDDEWGLKLAREAAIPVTTVATITASPGFSQADWRVTDVVSGGDRVGSSFTLRGPHGEAVDAVASLPGSFNVSNAALAIVIAHLAGADMVDAARGVETVTSIPGRMEVAAARTESTPLVINDYAHTPEGLELALAAVRPITKGKVWNVFGTDGDRFAGKRAPLAAVAARMADELVITDENPREEDPASMRATLLEGIRSVRPNLEHTIEVVPRAAAVAYALAHAAPEDTVIITGKGDEPYQEIHGVFHTYNDRDVVNAVFADESIDAFCFE